ncbi:hypothetical protein LCGC14_3145330 [marine sediment metagenome]|uniref:Uncharacterized protein n=1 Tax=marine sediment metagenome TaxID=412755 RepID=A0A0F8VVT0_9ZZZZ
MKLNNLFEVNYAGAKTLRNLMRFFIQDNNAFDERGYETEEDFQQEVGQYFRLSDDVIARYYTDVTGVEDVGGVSIGGDRRYKYTIWGPLRHVDEIAHVEEKDFVTGMQIFAKPKQLY